MKINRFGWQNYWKTMASQSKFIWGARMKNFNFLIVLFFGLILFLSFNTAKAQNGFPPDAPERRNNRQNRPNLISTLNLTTEQRQQIRKVNQEKKPFVLAAQQKFREATEKLDHSIYADSVNESEFQTNLRNVQLAQSELIKIRLTNELAIRRILTPEQLIKFRDLREQFRQKMENSEVFPSAPPLQNLKRKLRLRKNQS